MTRLPLLVAVAVVLSACGGDKSASPSIPTGPTTSVAKRFAGGELTPPRTSPALSLHDVDGKTVTLAAQRGRYVLVTFLYVNCPDVCPLIAQNLNAALRRLGSARKDVRVLAVSVDPQGDTVAAVRRYRRERALLPEFRYLIGSRAELRRTWAAWDVLAVRKDPALVDHVAYTALIDTSGRQRVLYDSQVKAADVLHDLRALMSARS
jgi:protein SCO1